MVVENVEVPSLKINHFKIGTIAFHRDCYTDDLSLQRSYSRTGLSVIKPRPELRPPPFWSPPPPMNESRIATRRDAQVPLGGGGGGGGGGGSAPVGRRRPRW